MQSCSLIMGNWAMQELQHLQQQTAAAQARAADRDKLVSMLDKCQADKRNLHTELTEKTIEMEKQHQVLQQQVLVITCRHSPKSSAIEASSLAALVSNGISTYRLKVRMWSSQRSKTNMMRI